MSLFKKFLVYCINVTTIYKSHTYYASVYTNRGTSRTVSVVCKCVRTPP